METKQPELISIVNENDVVIGSATKSRVYSEGLLHRVAHILIFNQSGKIILQKRSAKKDFCPLHWSSSSHGHVRFGEDYVDAAMREANEELGIDVIPRYIRKFRYQSIDIGKFIGVCVASYFGNVKPDHNDVLTHELVHYDNIDKFLHGRLVHGELRFLMENIKLRDLYLISMR